MTPTFLSLGDTALTIEFSREIDVSVNERVLALDEALRHAKIAGLVEVLPTYRSLMVQFNPLMFDISAFKTTVLTMLEHLQVNAREPKTWHVPVVYDGEDLEEVARFHNMSVSRVIELHSAPLYRVYMLGFLPGYAYLGGLDARLHTPRRDLPRLITPAGTISIGGIQACVASVEAPSGWHLLGRTPFQNYDPLRDPVCLIEAGDHVRFMPIDGGM